MSFGVTQDLSGFTEADPGSQIGVTAARVTATSLARNVNAWVVLDKGANWFAGDFKHRVAARITAATTGGWMSCWCLANNVGDARWLQLNAAALLVNLYYDGANYQVRLREASGGDFFTATYNVAVNTTYYLEIERLEGVGTYGTLYCRIYSDSGFSILLTTLSLALHAKTDYRYLYALNAYNDSGAGVISAYTENLDLNERWTAAGRGLHLARNSWTAAGRGRHKCIYVEYRLSGRGLHLARNSWTAAGRGLHAVLSTYSAVGRGLHAVLSTYSAAGRGLHLARNAWTAAGRGLHAVCRQYVAQGQGLHRAANAALARYELFVGVDAAPDFTAAPFETFTSLPHVTAALDPAPAGSERTYHLVLRARNAYNLASRNVDEWTVTVDDAGAVVTARPSAPEEVAIEAAAGGTVRVTARYMALEDGADAATRWLVYLRSNGTDPNPAVDTPTVVTMVRADGNARLSWTSGAFADGADVRVLVRSRRIDTTDPGPPPVTVNIDSTNVDVHSAAADTDGPAAVSPAGVFFGTLHEQAQ